MPKKPSRDDEQDEQAVYSETSYPRRRTVGGQARQSYADDEHPEIPQIRRASLPPDETPVPASLNPRVRGRKLRADEPQNKSETRRQAAEEAQSRQQLTDKLQT